MKLNEHLLTCLGEEGSEISQTVSKILRFGLHDVNVLKPDGPDNQQRLIDELNDLLGVIILLIQEKILPEQWMDTEKQIKKAQKVLEFVRYAIEKGTITD